MSTHNAAIWLHWNPVSYTKFKLLQIDLNSYELYIVRDSSENNMNRSTAELAESCTSSLEAELLSCIANLKSPLDNKSFPRTFADAAVHGIWSLWTVTMRYTVLVRRRCFDCTDSGEPFVMANPPSIWYRGIVFHGSNLAAPREKTR